MGSGTRFEKCSYCGELDDPPCSSQQQASGCSKLREVEEAKRKRDLTIDSGDGFLEQLEIIAAEDVAGLKKAQESYGNSWKLRGGVGAFMMLARKWDRLEKQMKRFFTFNRSRLDLPNVYIGAYDIFGHIMADQRSEGVIDDIRDLRRYLMLVEAEMRARGFNAAHRDNK